MLALQADTIDWARVEEESKRQREFPKLMDLRVAINNATGVVPSVSREGLHYDISVMTSAIPEYKSKLDDVKRSVALFLDGFKPKGVTYSVRED